MNSEFRNSLVSIKTNNFFQSDMIQSTAKAMDDKLKSTSEDSWQQEVVKIAQLLDPSIKTSLLPAADAKLQAVNLLKKYYGYYERESDAIPNRSLKSTALTSSIRSDVLKLLNKNSSGEGDEVDKYLGSGVEPDCKPLEWWSKHRMVYPALARLVIDFLAVCASSVESERWFSQSGRVITKSRCSLGTNSVQIVMCLKSWYNHVFVCASVDLTEE